MARLPSQSVLRHFRVAPCSLERVTGGQGNTFRAADLAIKHCRDHGGPEKAEWLAEVMDGVIEDGFRIARPVRADTGRFVVEGWCATRWIAGTPAIADRWAEAIAACQSFHRALRDVPYAPALGAVSNPYEQADAELWGETPTCDPALGPLAQRLRKRLRPVTLPAQLIQGDPGEGNMLFAPGLPVGIIDIAPYWRPADYALAMLLADGIAWSGGPLALLDVVKELPEIDQLLARAILFRLKVGFVFGGPGRAARRAERYAPMVEAMERWQSI